MQFAPFLLDPGGPPEGRPQPPPASPPSESRAYLEERAQAAGIGFTPGRRLRSSSHLAHQAAEFAAEHGEGAAAFHRGIFEAYFERLEDIGEVATLVRIARDAGLPGERLREALEGEIYRARVDEAVRGARLAGVRSVPSFIFDEEYAIVGAQEYTAFQSVMAALGREPRADGGAS